ncbi:hypothetical protein LEP1GSC169_0251 [Leptospira santarosai str. HAI1349]|nr:hypothetical protein LEP1GSC071_0022 [Leptospira santarosai str. JET]EMJ48144.1 hypothetical protein LEP1GSC169_0251 [Leptospira santarosai str. HAI1349]EMK02763.1 hypothetical protein LEP1GSC176_0635 [Leptospira kirschneri str. MMD1493]EMK14175.1 hypothetical protein LEP1GSC042_1899 [Leptospira kirschneri serovar Bim str. PUO 1247]EMM86571.1 hypothetical protein LEP1GSC039_1515 [Leptospira santarosai str. 2000027870]EMP82865.1 hypothetical protein LEP1GSC162_2511 [Leptospira santarosai str
MACLKRERYLLRIIILLVHSEQGGVENRNPLERPIDLIALREL